MDATDQTTSLFVSFLVMKDAEVHHITLAGEYDIARRSELSAAFGAVTNGAPVTIDMSKVTYVDSTFLSELAMMRMRMQQRSVTLLGVHRNVLRVLQITKLDRFFTLASPAAEPRDEQSQSRT
jgi:anti-anti-sigma factor